MGRELDREVAEKVMGWELREKTAYVYPIWFGENAHNIAVDRWEPSKNISDAFLVVSRMEKWGFQLTKVRDPLWPDGSYQAEFFGIYNFHEIATSAPEAICRAALKAVGGGE